MEFGFSENVTGQSCFDVRNFAESLFKLFETAVNRETFRYVTQQ